MALDITYLTWDNNSLPDGDRIPVINKNAPPMFMPLADITAPIATNTAKIAEIEAHADDNLGLILDNQARIENLENADARFNLLAALANSTIKHYFTDDTEIEVMHNRKTILYKKVMVQEINTTGVKQYRDVTYGVHLIEREDLINNIWVKKLIIQSQNPITGYVEIL